MGNKNGRQLATPKPINGHIDSLDSASNNTENGDQARQMTTRPIMVKKPVITLYPTEDMETVTVTVALLHQGLRFTTAYPTPRLSKLYHSFIYWKCKVAKDGTIQYEGAEYPYLFWEGKLANTDIFYDMSVRGLFNIQWVPIEQFAKHAELELDAKGLNIRERTDCITNWIEEIGGAVCAGIIFLDDEYLRNIQLTIDPAPNSLKRVYALIATSVTLLNSESYNPARHAEDIKKTRVTSDTPKGFTVVEWGSFVVNLDYMLEEGWILPIVPPAASPNSQIVEETK